MQLQDIFNRVYLGLKSQGFERSMVEDEVASDGVVCAYRGAEGRKCAVGHLIPDELYTELVEGHPVYVLIEGKSIDLPDEDGEIYATPIKDAPENVQALVGHMRQYLPFAHAINRIQKLHDNCFAPSQMKRELGFFAQEHGLTIPEEG